MNRATGWAADAQFWAADARFWAADAKFVGMLRCEVVR
jgi:hypothetical protein